MPFGVSYQQGLIMYLKTKLISLSIGLVLAASSFSITQAYVKHSNVEEVVVEIKTPTITTIDVLISEPSNFENRLHCMTEAIYYEAGGESFEGKTAVAQVVINRTQDGRFPTDICDVVYQKSMHRGKILCQFSWVCDQRRRSVDDSLWRESKYIAYLALTMNIINVNIALHNAIFFHSVSVRPNWFGKQKVTQIGNHIFYAKLQDKDIQ